MTDVEAEFNRLGPYVLLRASGAGGMARIDLALRGRPEAAEVCVLKRLHADFRSPEQEARFRREADIASRLSHDAIARTLCVDEIDGELLLLQELLMGVDLRRLAARMAAIGERLPVPIAVYVASEMARALEYAHAFADLGIVHRDVTPDNIMLAFSGVVKLVDFGIARSNADTALTQAGFVVGRPTYTAPEVWAGARADCRADIYSLGVVLWQLLAGRPLEPGESAPSPSHVNPEVPGALSAVSLRAFDADPARRYQSAGTFREALAPHLSESTAAGPLAELLARHFDVEREQRMLAEDVARAKPLLAVGEPDRAPRSAARAAAKGRAPLLIAVAAMLLVNVAFRQLASRRSRAAIAPNTAAPLATARPAAVSSTMIAPATPATISEAPVVAALPVVPAKRAPEPALPSAVASKRTRESPRPAPGPARTTEPTRDVQPPVNAKARINPSPAAEPERTASPRVNVDKLLAEAQASFDRGDLGAALTFARDAAKAGAGGAAYILIGTVMMNQRRYDEAERAFAQATHLDPKDARAARLLAMVGELRKMGRDGNDLGH